MGPAFCGPTHGTIVVVPIQGCVVSWRELKPPLEISSRLVAAWMHKLGVVPVANERGLRRSKTMRVAGQKREKSGIGGRACTMAEAGPTDLLYGSRVQPKGIRTGYTTSNEA